MSRPRQNKTRRAYGFLREVDGEVGIGRDLVLVVDTGETLDLASSSLGVDAPSVSLLAVVEGSRDVDEEEVSSSSSSVLDNVRLGDLARSVVRGDGGSDDGSSGTRELSW